MSQSVEFVTRYGYSVLVLWIFFEQVGLPLPAAPVLLAAGALAVTGKMKFSAVVLLAWLVALIMDVLWYELGLRRRNAVLKLVCLLSLNKDSCARQTERIFSRFGAPSLLIAKFVPGLHIAAAPLSGVFGMKRWRFLLFDALGTLLWAVIFAGLGFLFSGELQLILLRALKIGGWLPGAALWGSISIFVLVKYVQRRRFLKELIGPKITPEHLKEKLDRGEPVVIVDVRHPLDLLSTPFTLPGAIRIPLEKLKEKHAEIRQDAEIVLYCTCPNQASSAHAVQLLRLSGFSDVKALVGGFDSWRKKGYSVEPFKFTPGENPGLRPIWAF